MIKHLLVLALSFIFFIATSALVIDDFEVFKTEYNKRYLNEEEEAYCKSVFVTNKKYIEDHNSDPSNTYTLKINEFADIETQEFFQARNKLLDHKNNVHSKSSRIFNAPAGLTLPESVNWRKKGVVTEVKDQGSCGSCWAFSATGSLEGQHALKYGKNVSLSEQQLVDCSNTTHGCNGGSVDRAFDYINKTGGIDTESSYPYIGKDGTCRFSSSSTGASCTGHISIASGNCSDLKKAVASVGPISVYMDANHTSFMHYGGGIYSSKYCSLISLDHAVLVVGYGTDNGTDYWLVKNSWGKSWGMDGYFKIASENGMCGICEYGYYPTV